MDCLFDVETKPRRTHGHLPVFVDTSLCPECGSPTFDSWMGEQSLFIHGGYGATRMSDYRACSQWCGWSVTFAVTETNPRHPR